MEMLKITNKKQFITNFLLFVISSLFSICVVEFTASHFIENKILRKAVLDWRNEDPNVTDCFRLSDELGIEPVWGRCGYPDINSYINANESSVLGKSNQEEYRIIILGDSNTKRANFDRLLEDNLNRMFQGGDKKFSVIKIGVESYNTWQEVELLKSKAIKLKPNLIIFQFTLNDFWFSPVALRLDNRIVYFSSKGEKSFEANNFLFKYSSLYRLYALNKLLVNEKFLTDYNDEDVFMWKDKVESMEKNLDTFKQILTKENIPSVVVIYPIFGDTQMDRERNTIINLLEKRDIQYVDLLPISEQYGGPIHFQDTENGQVDTLHPKRSFDTIVANALTECVVSNLDEQK